MVAPRYLGIITVEAAVEIDVGDVVEVATSTAVVFVSTANVSL